MANHRQFDTALCIIPPRHLWPQFDRVRSRYDEDFPSWPPHIKLVYPFLPFKELGTHLGDISEALENFGSILLRLGATDHISCEDGRHEVTFLHVDDVEHVDGDGGRTFPLDRLCEAVLLAAPSLERAHWYRSMTVGQSFVGKPVNETQLCVLRAGGLSGIGWEVDELHVLVRTSSTLGSCPNRSQMTDWASISLQDGGLRIHQKRDTRLRGFVVGDTAVAARIDVPDIRQFYKDSKPQSPKQHLPFFHNGAEWVRCTPDCLHQRSLSDAQSTLSVASYNVLGRKDDFARLTQNILHIDAKADILILQEATDVLLSQLLRNKDVQERYPFCTRRPFDSENSDAFPAQKTVVVLGKYAFDWEAIPLPVCNTNVTGELAKTPENEDKTRAHHRALLVELRRKRNSAGPWEKSTPVAIAAFHLSPGLDSAAYLARASEIDAIRQHTSWATSAILAGGFNMPTSALTLRYLDIQQDLRHLDRELLSNGYVDAWMVAKMDSGAETDNDPIVPSFQGEQGFTDEGAFHRALIDGTAPGKLLRRPQRLDRILIKSPGIVIVQSFNKFGKFFKVEEENSVDKNCHLGVRAVLRFEYQSDNLDTFSLADKSASNTSRISQGLPSRLSGHENVLEALRRAHGIPLFRERQLRKKAFEALKVALTGAALTHHIRTDPEKQKLDLALLPIGSYALDVWTPSSGLDCLCVGTFSLSTFTDIATQRIQQAIDEGMRLIRKTDSPMGTTLEIVFEDRLSINLTYARAPWPLPSSGPTRHFSPDTLKALRAYKELDYVRRSVPDIVVFRLAHRFIKAWAEIRGIYSAKLGYLNGIQITILLTRVHKRMVIEAVWPTVPELLFTFFKEYAVFDWEKNMVFDECFHRNLSYSRASWEPLAILSYFPPALNASLAVTISSVRAIRSEFQQAAKLLDQVNGTWADLLRVSIPDCPTSGSLAADDFLMRHQRYIKIGVQYWGGSATKGRGFISSVESRLPLLLADLDIRLKILRFRIWPTRFQENWHDNEAQPDLHAEEGEYQGAFLVGVDLVGKACDSPGSGKAMVETLNKFGQQIRSDERHFNAESMAISFNFQRSLENFMPRNGLSTGQDFESPRSVRFRVDHRNWEAYIRLDEALDIEGAEWRSRQAATVQSEWSASSRNTNKFATNQPRSAVGPKPQGMGKFRSAADVLNRLRWDATYDQNDFVVGYEDRFLGAMERQSDDWKSEQTHEEFIPQHRILYFKRKSNGVLVWERRTRMDLVFGSS